MANFENMVFSMGRFTYVQLFSCETFHVFLDVLPIMVIALSNFGWVKSYGSVCRVLYYDALVMLWEWNDFNKF
jgi:hypothetical protein